MAIRMTASEKAGSSVRASRRRLAVPSDGRRVVPGVEHGGHRASLMERRLDHLLLGDVVGAEFGDDAAVAEHVDAVAIVELFGLRGVPQERAAGARLRADEVVDLELGAVVDAAHRIVHQDDPGIGAERPREQRLLLVAARQRQDVVVGVGRADLDLVDPAFRPARARGVAKPASRRAGRRSSGCRYSRRSTTAERCRRPGGRRRPAPPARSPRCAACRREAAPKISRMSLRLAMSGEPGQADDLAFMRGELGAVGLRAAAWRARAAAARPPARRYWRAPRRLRCSTSPMAATSFCRSKAAALPAATTLPSRMTTMRSRIVEHLAEQMRDQDGADAAGDGAAHEGQQLAGRVGVERRGRLVEDDQVQRIVGDGEGARHLDHLAPADRQVAHDVRGCDVVARKDLVELGEDELAGAATPAETLQRAVIDASVFGDRQIGAERQFLEHAAHAEVLGERCRIAALRIAADDDRSAVRRARAGKHVHQRRLAGAVVADQPDAFAAPDGEIDAVERANGAELNFDALQVNDCGASLSHRPPS